MVNTMKKTLKKVLKKEHIFYLGIIISFLILSTIISLKHEYWPDETNAWLIARDSSIVELFTKYLRTDGHPALFHLIIKAFQFFGLSYTNFRVISILFSTLGVAVFVFKSKFKWYLKALLPFTYFIFYQYTVITRGYCLILLLLSLIATIWEKKNEKCFLYTLLLVLLLSLESYTFLIAGSLFLLWIIDYIKEYKQNKKHNPKLLVCFAILFLSFLLTTIYVFPRNSNTYVFSRVTTFTLDRVFLSPYQLKYVIGDIICVLILTFITYVYIKEKSLKKAIELLIISLPVVGYLTLFYCSPWHFGIILILALFIIWIHELNTKIYINIFLLLVCIIQISWSVKSSIYDYKETYCPTKEVAEFLKPYLNKNYRIMGHTFYEEAINAYYEKNIFYNMEQDIGFRYLTKNSIYYNYKYDTDSIIKESPDILVTTYLGKKSEKNKDVLDYNKLQEKYDKYEFKAYTYFENTKYANMTAYVFIKKGLVK